MLQRGRWRVEEFYKTLKSYAKAKRWHTNNGKLIRQEIFIRSIICTVASILKDKTSFNDLTPLLVKCIIATLKILNGENINNVIKYINIFCHKPYEKGRVYERM